MRFVIFLSLLTSIAYGDLTQIPLDRASDNAHEIRAFMDAAREKHGDFGEQAAEFLVLGMPAQDLKQLDQEFLMENLDLAMLAREQFPWAKAIPQEIFFNDVLPYASLDETRERWRKKFYEEVSKLVSNCKTTTEAAQAINQNYFNVINVHYNTGRKRPNQSPSESIDLGMATCTGLSIIFVDACRSVGVPARVVGTPLWTNKRGNHTWVEIWDSGQWHFTGADEYDSQGLNRGWFTQDASKALVDNWKHAIWATSWKKTGNHFPMVWNLSSKEVPAVNVTPNYARDQVESTGETSVYFRAFEHSGGQRLAAKIKVSNGVGEAVGSVVTKSGQTDLNDMPMLKLPNHRKYRVEVEFNNQVRTTTMVIGSELDLTQEWNWSELQPTSPASKSNAKVSTPKPVIERWLSLLPEERHLSVPEMALSRQEAQQALALIWATLRTEQSELRRKEIANRLVVAAGMEMKYLEREFGNSPTEKKPLWISMHGGGGAPAAVNDQQWNNQIRLYEPDEGIVVAPRAPTNSWNLWHENHIDLLMDRLIENFVLLRDVDPERVYLMGYSAGGDGVYQLSPRLADRFAAAAMMAGHPNDASPLGLRNLPFMVFMGGEDAAYDRNKVAAQWKIELGNLQQADPEGYIHKVTIYEGLGHWMEGKDAEALPWMASHSRNTWPTKLVWRQSNRTHSRFYWLAVPEELAKGGQTIRAEVDQQTIKLHVEGNLDQLTLRLSDSLINLDKPVTVIVNGETVFSGTVQRTHLAIWNSLTQRLDPNSVATCELPLHWKASSTQ